MNGRRRLPVAVRGSGRDCAQRAGDVSRGRARPACRYLDRAAGASVAQSPARSGGGPGARARVATRLLETSAAAVVARGFRLPADRRHPRGLYPRAALGRRLHVDRVAARARHRRRFPVADRRAGARRHPLLQFLGAEVRARPDAASVLGDDRPVPLSRHHRRTRARLAARGRRARAVLLVEIRRLRARRQRRLVHAVRSGRAAHAAHARPLARSARLLRGDRA